MANLGSKNGIFFIRFRYRGSEYKKSLKTTVKTDADAAKRSVEQTIHRLLIGLRTVPPDVDAADFIVSGGTMLHPVQCPKLTKSPALPSTVELKDEYLKSHVNRMAESYHYSQAMHLR